MKHIENNVKICIGSMSTWCYHTEKITACTHILLMEYIRFAGCGNKIGRKDKSVMQVSDYELELMKIIWSHHGEAMYNEILEDLNKNGEQWTKNTIITLLSRLVDKRMITVCKIGRKNKYKAIVTEPTYQASQTIQFLDKVFGGNPKDLVSTLLETNLLSENDYNELKEYWESGMRNNE